MSLTVKNSRGQVSLMIAMVMTTFILFFAFVVNVGMLVNAKINLQNAADLAAYAGAAVQARQLNDLAHLNYEMRRQYKKFLFRYYVIGGYAQKTFQATGGWRKWGPTDDKFGVPTVCISFNPQYNNVCQNDVLTGIPIPPPSTLDTINATLAAQLTDLENIRKSDCRQIGALNITALVLWLWNTDPTAEKVMENVTSIPGLPEMVERLKGLVKGLGLIPRELLLQMRANTLVRYINFKPYKGVNLEKMQTIQSEGDIHARERTIQAFKSAYATLGEHTFSDPEEITMDELVPESPDGAALIMIKPFALAFDTYAVNMEPNAATGGTATADCHLRPTPFSTGMKVPLGFYKDPAMLTYYAVRLTAKARVLFSPFGDVTMRAYGSAQPFGSRVGPRLSEADAKTEFTFDAGKGGPNGCISAVPAADNPPPCVGLIPNLPVLGIDATSAGREKGWNHNDVIHSMFEKFREVNATTDVSVIDDVARDRAYQGAMVPNPPEKGRYNIPNDLIKDPMFEEFEDPQGGGAARKRAIWAPIVSQDVITSGGDAKDVIKKEIDKVFVGGGLPNNPIVSGLLSTMEAGMGKYVESLHQGNGEDGEGYNVARITDPYKIYDPATRQSIPITHSPSSIVLGVPAEARSGYVSTKDSDIRNAGRTGYSVKMVPLKVLRTPAGVTSDGTAVWGNVLPAIDSAVDEDLESIEH